jgi:hypothetical protein
LKRGTEIYDFLKNKKKIEIPSDGFLSIEHLQEIRKVKFESEMLSIKIEYFRSGLISNSEDFQSSLKEESEAIVIISEMLCIGVIGKQGNYASMNSHPCCEKTGAPTWDLSGVGTAQKASKIGDI